MPKIKTLKDDNKTLHVFYCPVCEMNHAFDERWEFNGDYEKPTFHPSLIVNEGKCHSYVISGEIQYLLDCQHEHAGHRFEIPEWED